MSRAIEIARQVDIRQVLGNDTVLRRAANTGGGEYEGACPFCGGRNRFRVWPATGRYWCRRCQRQGDTIQYMRDKHALDFQSALAALAQDSGQETPTVPYEPEPLRPPPADWQVRGFEFMFECQQALWDRGGARALAWLRGRGLQDEIMRRMQLGYNKADRHEARAHWGLPPATGGDRPIWLPRGVVIPWEIAGQLWRLNIRRPLSRGQIARGLPKYMGPAGGSNALYNADRLATGRPAILLEGELDACIVAQAAGDLVCAVATGSTAGARRIPWLALLACADSVLIAFDNDAAGEEAARYWLDGLPQARRWRPYWADASAMAQDGVDVRAWVQAGLER